LRVEYRIPAVEKIEQDQCGDVAPTGGAVVSHHAGDRLFGHLAVAWGILTVHGSLYPFSGWRLQSGIDPFAWFNMRWPRYWTAFDMGINVLVYLPLGFCVTLALCHRFRRRFFAPLCAAFLGVFLSFSMETLQSWLPSRVASNLDLACNSLGVLLGSLAAVRAGGWLLACWHTLRQRLIAPLPHVDLGLTLLGLWLLTLLAPENLPFSTGNLHSLLEWLPMPRYDPKTYHLMETASVAANLLAVGLFAGAMTRGRWMAFPLAALLFLLAFLIQSLGAALLGGPENCLAWLTPGAGSGLRAGGLLLCLALLLPPASRLILSALALLAATLLTNLAPADPYFTTPIAAQWQTHLLNFNGLTHWIASIWPFLALPYLSWVLRTAISPLTDPVLP
jgi:VanZ family protein